MVWFRGLLAPLPLIGIAAALLLLPAGLACGVWNWPRGWLALALGSYAALIAASFFLIMTLARIVIEEAFLRKALPDYAAYAARVRARLIPYLL